ncbi:hypothetical protein P3X46_018293 [Hevea brasiliensis]|uniref:Aspartic peptidase DDI1-type domain-containing protein n=1 Tax=Hevea brasiliensis TaxID=3981 RepID=A0ABQ9LSG3_HEVBR|nr:hypothetical protein P3X46_018293 [Hevea brasiliensis]
MEKSEDEAFSALDKIAYNNYQWSCERNEIKKLAGMFELDAMNMINAKFDALTRKMDKLTSSSSNKAFGKLPSQPENSREHCKAITLRSGKILKDGDKKIEEKVEEKKSREGDEQTEAEVRIEAEKENSMEEKGSKERESKEEEPKYVAPKAYIPPLPFPQRFQKAKLDKQFGKFLEVLKSLHVTIPFTDALAQMPSYAKFLNEILSNKKKLEEFETVALTEESNAILQNKLPPKLKDPGSFSMPCHIGDISIDKALCDLGASVSLMPLSIYEKVKIGEMKPTTISL